MANIKLLQERAIANKVAKGFNITDIPLEFMLLTEEVAEAFEAWRKKKPDVGEELADIMIYLLGLAEILGFDLDKEVTDKMKKNEKRKYVTKNGVLLKEESI